MNQEEKESTKAKINSTLIDLIKYFVGTVFLGLLGLFLNNQIEKSRIRLESVKEENVRLDQISTHYLKVGVKEKINYIKLLYHTSFDEDRKTGYKTLLDDLEGEADIIRDTIKALENNLSTRKDEINKKQEKLASSDLPIEQKNQAKDSLIKLSDEVEKIEQNLVSFKKEQSSSNYANISPTDFTNNRVFFQKIDLGKSESIEIKDLDIGVVTLKAEKVRNMVGGSRAEIHIDMPNGANALVYELRPNQSRKFVFDGDGRTYTVRVLDIYNQTAQVNQSRVVFEFVVSN